MGAGARLALAAAAGAGALLCGVGLLAVSAWLISRAAQHPPVLSLMVAIVAVRTFGLARGALRYAERLASHDAALRLLARARVRVYERLAALAPGGLREGRWRGGELLDLVVGAAEGTAERWLRGLLPMAAAAAAGAGAVALEWWLLPPAGAVLLGALLAGGVLAPWLAARAAARAEARAAAGRAELAGGVAELLNGLPELIAYGAVPGRLQELARADARVAGAAARSAWTAGLGSALTALSAGAAVLGALLFGVPAVRAGELDGVLLAAVALTPLAAFETLGSLSAGAQRMLRSREEAARVRAVLDAPDPVAEPAGPRPLPGGPYRLRVAGLRARWPGAASDAIDGLDLELPPGRRIAIMGRSGSGKSTLAAVLARFLDYAGSVTLNGVELRDLAADDVRSAIALSAQDAYLFDTTVAENVRPGRPGAADAEVAAALGRAGLDAGPERLAAPVGEHGAAVSGGERRRIALARALLSEAPILVLDEPDAHLDEETAGGVLADLLAAAGDRTIILITHRPAIPGADPVLRHVDEVVTLDHGEDPPGTPDGRPEPAFSGGGRPGGRP